MNDIVVAQASEKYIAPSLNTYPKDVKAPEREKNNAKWNHKSAALRIATSLSPNTLSGGLK